MAWAKLDDKFHGNPKVLQADLPAIGLYALGLSYCVDQLTDGFVPEIVVKSWRNQGKFSAKTLVKVGLWSVEKGGYRVHDYLQWNPSRVQILQERKEAAERKKNAREREASGWTPPGRPPGRQAPTPRHATLTPDVTKVTSPEIPQTPPQAAGSESGALPPPPRGKPRQNGTNPRATATNPRATGTNPRVSNTNPRRQRAAGFEFDENGPRYEQRVGADGKREWVEVEA